MEKVHVLYNPRSGNNTGENESKKLDIIMGYELIYHDITQIDNYENLFEKIDKKDKIILAGGDGTLSRFVTDIMHIEHENEIYYYATGSGNDFLKDLNFKKGDKPFPINKFLKNLPVMSVGGKEQRFVNGGGAGLDAYSCAECNKIHAKGKKANYVSTAIKGILYDFAPVNITVTVDGETREFKKVWFASVMKGRYFGGGIMLAPKQNRNSGKLSLVVIHKVGKLKLLTIIPGAFKGAHVKYTEYVTIIEGNDIKVKFDRPLPMQIDGETTENITEYSVKLDKEIQESDKSAVS